MILYSLKNFRAMPKTCQESGSWVSQVICYHEQLGQECSGWVVQKIVMDRFITLLTVSFAVPRRSTNNRLDLTMCFFGHIL